MDEQKRIKTYLDEHSKLETNVTCGDPIISKLSDDCLIFIFNLLSVEDRLSVEKVCKKWQQVSDMSWVNMKTLKIDSYLIKDKYEEKPGIWVLPSLNHVLSLCGDHLDRVQLPHYSDHCLDILKLLKTNCPNLNSLDFNDNTITSHEADFMLRNFNNLIDITFAKYWPSSEKIITKFCWSNNKLKSIKINFSERVTGTFLPALPKSVESLFIRNCKHFDPSNIAKAIKKLPNLRTLSLWGSINFIENLDSILQKFPENSNLADLTLESTDHRRISKRVFIKHFVNLTNLQDLQIAGNIMLHSSNLQVISQHCKKLSRVWFLECDHLSTEDFENFVGALNLDELHICNCEIDDISYMSSLKVLSFQYCYNLFNDNFDEVLKSQNLKKLNVLQCDYVDGNTLIENAFDACTSNELLELTFQQHSKAMCKVRIVPSRLYIIKNDLNLPVKDKHYKMWFE